MTDNFSNAATLCQVKIEADVDDSSSSSFDTDNWPSYPHNSTQYSTDCAENSTGCAENSNACVKNSTNSTASSTSSILMGELIIIG